MIPPSMLRSETSWAPDQSSWMATKMHILQSMVLHCKQTPGEEISEMDGMPIWIPMETPFLSWE